MLFKFFLIGLGYTVGDVLMKLWSQQSYSLSGVSLVTFIAALMTYSAAFIYFGLQLRTTNFTIALLLPIVINVILIFLLTVFYYHEPFSLKQSLGVILGLVAVVLLH